MPKASIDLSGPALESVAAAARHHAQRPRLSLARVVIILYLAGLLVALVAGGTASQAPISDHSTAPGAARGGDSESDHHADGNQPAN